MIWNPLNSKKKIPAGIFVEFGKLILRFIQKCTGLTRGKTTMKKNKVDSDFKTYYKRYRENMGENLSTLRLGEDFR